MTTVKGQVLFLSSALAWQKLRKVTPLPPFSTRNTFPLMHWLEPICLAASANETQSCEEGLPAEQNVLSARTVPRRKVGVEKRIMSEVLRSASSIFILGAAQRSYGERNENIRGVFPERNLTLGSKDCHAASTPVIKHKPEAESDEHC